MGSFADLAKCLLSTCRVSGVANGRGRELGFVQGRDSLITVTYKYLGMQRGGAPDRSLGGDPEGLLEEVSRGPSHRAEVGTFGVASGRGHEWE